jgi:hypothetical protein
VAFYSPDQAHPIVGPPTRHEDIRISRRLDSDRRVSTASATIKNSAQQQKTALLYQMQTLGWMINTKKSQLHPTPVLDHLGFQLDSQSMTIRLPGTKIRDSPRSISTVLKHPTQTPRLIHSLTMRIKSATLAIFPANLYTLKR